jgi:hypothetical protein
MSELLDAIDDGDVHDQLMLHNAEDESCEETIGRLLRAAPSSNNMECMECGREIEDLADADWTASRLRVRDADHRRTDLFCGPNCIVKSLTSLGIAEIEPIADYQTDTREASSTGGQEDD